MRRLACSVAWKLSFSVSPRVALPFPQFALLHSLTCVKLRLLTILGNCGCVGVASFLSVPPVLQYVAAGFTAGHELIAWNIPKRIILQCSLLTSAGHVIFIYPFIVIQVAIRIAWSNLLADCSIYSNKLFWNALNSNVVTSSVLVWAAEFRIFVKIKYSIHIVTSWCRFIRVWRYCKRSVSVSDGYDVCLISHILNTLVTFISCGRRVFFCLTVKPIKFHEITDHSCLISLHLLSSIGA
jgi:hypothetical protein